MDEVPDRLQSIGGEMSALLPARTQMALLYYEAEEGALSPSLFYKGEDQRVRYVETSAGLDDAVRAYWESCADTGVEWRAIEYVLEAGRFTVDLTYPDQIDEDEPEFDRRPRVIKRHFGEVEVDYGDPAQGAEWMALPDSSEGDQGRRVKWWRIWE